MAEWRKKTGAPELSKLSSRSEERGLRLQVVHEC